MAVGGRHLKVELRSLSSLLPHEETSGLQTKVLAEELLRDGVQRDPLIIDRKTGVVLDGMHRLAALEELGVGHVVCAALEYGSRDIVVGRWARVYVANAPAEVGYVLEKLGFRKKVARSVAVKRLESRGTSLAAMTTEGCFLPTAAPGLRPALELVRRADSVSSSAGWRQEFVPDDEIDAALQDDRSLVLLVCRIDKEDVLNAATTKRLFPIKTSMHIIDPRPVAVNVPLAELKEGSAKSLDARLRAAKYTLLPQNSIYCGRKYKERLLKLSDH